MTYDLTNAQSRAQYRSGAGMRRADVILHYWMDGGHDAHSQSHSDDADDADDDDDDPGPARKPLFLAYTQSRAPQTAPTGQGQAIRSMERQRQACL